MEGPWAGMGSLYGCAMGMDGTWEWLGLRHVLALMDPREGWALDMDGPWALMGLWEGWTLGIYEPQLAPGIHEPLRRMGLEHGFASMGLQDRTTLGIDRLRWILGIYGPWAVLDPRNGSVLYMNGSQ